MMSDALVPTLMAGAIERSPQPGMPSLPWRDPHRVPKEELTALIARLEQGCLDQPHSADVRTCLGMARAMNFEVYKSMDALEDARVVDPSNFWAQMKYAELHYRLRTLKKAQAETEKAIELADNIWQLGIARRQ